MKMSEVKNNKIIIDIISRVKPLIRGYLINVEKLDPIYININKKSISLKYSYTIYDHFNTHNLNQDNYIEYAELMTNCYNHIKYELQNIDVNIKYNNSNGLGEGHGVADHITINIPYEVLCG